MRRKLFKLVPTTLLVFSVVLTSHAIGSHPDILLNVDNQPLELQKDEVAPLNFFLNPISGMALYDTVFAYKTFLSQLIGLAAPLYVRDSGEHLKIKRVMSPEDIDFEFFAGLEEIDEDGQSEDIFKPVSLVLDTESETKIDIRFVLVRRSLSHQLHRMRNWQFPVATFGIYMEMNASVDNEKCAWIEDYIRFLSYAFYKLAYSYGLKVPKRFISTTFPHELRMYPDPIDELESALAATQKGLMSQPSISE